MTTIADRPPIDPSRTLGELVAERPARARVLEAAGLDYCCRGSRSLADACAAAGLDAETVAVDLATVDASSIDVDATVDALPPVELVDHIVATHHAYLHAELPSLEELATKVASVHGARHPELTDVAALVTAIRTDLEPHLAKEEQVLFPAIRRLVSGGSLAQPVAVMRAEHEAAGELLAELRAVTRSYEVPRDGCASYRILYERLARLEADTFRHVHLENNVLFPAVT